MCVDLRPGGTYKLVEFPADRKGMDIGDYYGDFSRINKVLGWRPTVALRQGLTRTLAYYQQHHQHHWGASA